MQKKLRSLLFFILLLTGISSTHLLAQVENNNNILQPEMGGSGTSGIGEPSTFEPAPVDGNNGTLDPSSDPGGPGGDIDDLGAIPLDGGTSILLILGLLGGLVLINIRNNPKNEKQLHV